MPVLCDLVIVGAPCTGILGWLWVVLSATFLQLGVSICDENILQNISLYYTVIKKFVMEISVTTEWSRQYFQAFIFTTIFTTQYHMSILTLCTKRQKLLCPIFSAVRFWQFMSFLPRLAKTCQRNFH